MKLSETYLFFILYGCIFFNACSVITKNNLQCFGSMLTLFLRFKKKKIGMEYQIHTKLPLLTKLPHIAFFVVKSQYYFKNPKIFSTSKKDSVRSFVTFKLPAVKNVVPNLSNLDNLSNKCI